MTKDEIIEALKSMTLLEASELVKAIEETFDVSAQAAVAMPMAGMAGAGQAEAEEEQTEFAVILKEYGAEKIKVIKEVRTITGLGLKEAKDLVEAAPTEVAKDIPKGEAEELIKKLEAVGATVEIK